MENKRYKDLKVTPGTYVPPVNLAYPEDNPYEGMYKPVYDRDYPAINADYPFVDDSWQNTLRLLWGYYVVRPILGLVLRVKYGLRWTYLYNRKEYKQTLKGGAITIANHCYRHDCASVLTAFTLIITDVYLCSRLISEPKTSSTFVSSAVYLFRRLKKG